MSFFLDDAVFGSVIIFIFFNFRRREKQPLIEK
jgi:hypothetical protein